MFSISLYGTEDVGKTSYINHLSDSNQIRLNTNHGTVILLISEHKLDSIVDQEVPYDSKTNGIIFMTQAYGNGVNYLLNKMKNKAYSQYKPCVPIVKVISKCDMIGCCELTKQDDLFHVSIFDSESLLPPLLYLLKTLVAPDIKLVDINTEASSFILKQFKNKIIIVKNIDIKDKKMVYLLKQRWGFGYNILFDGPLEESGYYMICFELEDYATEAVKIEKENGILDVELLSI